MKTTSVPQEAVSLYNQALAFSNGGDYDTAMKEYKRAIEIYPHFVEAYNNLGEIYSRIGETDKAISTYKRALEIDKNDRVLLNLGVEYYNRSNYSASIPYFNESVALNPNFIEGNFYLGMTYYNLKNYQLAEKALSKTVKIDKKHLKANYLLSYIYYEWKQYKKTIKCLDNIRDIADDKLFVNKYYGFCYYHLGDYDRAIEFLSLAMESSPRYNKFKSYLKSLTYENRIREIGDLDKRIGEMEEKMMKERPSIREYSHLSMLYIFKGEFQKAENLLLSARC